MTSDIIWGGTPAVTYRYSTRLCFFLVVCFVLVAASSYSQVECRWNEGHFPQGPVGDVRAMAVYDDGSGPALYVGGDRFGDIAKWDGSQWSTIGSVGFGSYSGSVYAMAVFDDGSGPALYVGGRFKEVDGITVNSIAKWDGARWSALEGPEPGGPGVDSWVEALTAFDDGVDRFLVVGGHFMRAGGKKVWRAARWDGERWLGFSGPRRMGFDNDVFSLEVFDAGSGPELYAGGWFVRAGGSRAFGVARWDGRRWHRVGDTGQPGFLGTARDLMGVRTGALEGLYSIGSIIDVTQIQADAVARWDGERWVHLPDQPQIDDAWAAAQFEIGDGQSLFIAGRGSDYGEWARASLNRWDGQGWSGVPGTFYPDEMSGSFRALLVFDDGSGPALYAGGEFELLGEHGSENIARLTCVSRKNVEDQE